MFDCENEDDDLYLSDIGSLSQIYDDEKRNYTKNFSSVNRYKKHPTKVHWSRRQSKGVPPNKAKAFGKDDGEKSSRAATTSAGDDAALKQDADFADEPPQHKYTSPDSTEPGGKSPVPAQASSRIDLYDDDDAGVVLPEQSDTFKITRSSRLEEGIGRATKMIVDQLYDEFELNAADQNETNNAPDKSAIEPNKDRPKSLSDSLSEIIRSADLAEVPWRKNKTVVSDHGYSGLEVKSDRDFAAANSQRQGNDGVQFDIDGEPTDVDKKAFGKWLNKEYSLEEVPVDNLYKGKGDPFSRDPGAKNTDDPREITKELLDENYPSASSIIDMSYLYAQHRPVKVSIENNNKVEEDVSPISALGKIPVQQPFQLFENRRPHPAEVDDDIMILEDGAADRNRRRDAELGSAKAACDMSDSMGVGKTSHSFAGMSPPSIVAPNSNQKIPVLSRAVDPVSVPPATVHPDDTPPQMTPPTFAVPHMKQMSLHQTPATSASRPSFTADVDHHLRHGLMDRPPMFSENMVQSSYFPPFAAHNRPMAPPPTTDRYMNPFSQVLEMIFGNSRYSSPLTLLSTFFFWNFFRIRTVRTYSRRFPEPR